MKRFRETICQLSVLLICMTASINTTAQSVEQTLKQFDSKADAATANQFFAELLKAEFIDEKVTFAGSAPADSMRQQVWYWAAEWMYDRQQYETAAQYGKKALPLYHGGNDSKADCLNLLGLICVRMGDVKNAAMYAKQCLEIDMRSGDDDRISSSMNTVAGIYMAGYQAKEAEQYILGALKHAEKANNPARKAVIMGMASEIYHSLGNDDKALAYAEKAYQTDSMLKREPQASIRLSQKGSALLGLHRYSEAESIYRKVMPMLKASGDYHSYAIALNRMGMSLLCQEKQREAIPYYKEAAALFSKMGDIYNEMHSHRGLYESYWKLNPDSAKAELDYFDLLKDSLYSHSTADALSRYNAEFGNNQLQQENEQERKAHKRTIIICIIAIALVAACAWAALRISRRRQEQKIQELVREIENLKNTKADKAAKDDDTEQEQPAQMAEPDEDRLFLMRVIEIVNEGLPVGDYSVESVASKMNMSVQTFRRRLQSAAGESPKAYISAIQMNRASTLLTENPDMPILQVAGLCGFDETSSFSHTFKRVYGCSPKQYREQHHTASDS